MLFKSVSAIAALSCVLVFFSIANCQQKSCAEVMAEIKAGPSLPEQQAKISLDVFNDPRDKHLIMKVTDKASAKSLTAQDYNVSTKSFDPAQVLFAGPESSFHLWRFPGDPKGEFGYYQLPRRGRQLVKVPDPDPLIKVPFEDFREIWAAIMQVEDETYRCHIDRKSEQWQSLKQVRLQPPLQKIYNYMKTDFPEKWRLMLPH